MKPEMCRSRNEVKEIGPGGPEEVQVVMDWVTQDRRGGTERKGWEGHLR